VELNPRHPAALNELGVVYRKLGRFADARRSYDRRRAAPDFHFARLNLAILCDLYLADTTCALSNTSGTRRRCPPTEGRHGLADLRNRTGR
jgi:hypothetical protein